MTYPLLDRLREDGLPVFETEEWRDDCHDGNCIGGYWLKEVGDPTILWADICSEEKDASKLLARINCVPTLLQALDVAIEVLGFYEDPPRVDADGDPLPIPDFYGEMDFGETARAAREQLKTLLSTQGEG